MVEPEWSAHYIHPAKQRNNYEFPANTNMLVLGRYSETYVQNICEYLAKRREVATQCVNSCKQIANTDVSSLYKLSTHICEFLADVAKHI